MVQMSAMIAVENMTQHKSNAMIFARMDFKRSTSFLAADLLVDLEESCDELLQKFQQKRLNLDVDNIF
jgi:hypothetical protein